MEDIELNRDWSQPGKLRHNELNNHKKRVELILDQKKPKFDDILRFGDNLIESNHPASDDISPYMLALKNETEWLKDLMSMLGIHLIHLQEYENVCLILICIFEKRFLILFNFKFMKEYNEINVSQVESLEKFKNLTTSFSTFFELSGRNESLKNDFIAQFNNFKHNFQNVSQFKQQIERLYLFVDKLPNFRMRKINLKPPYDKSRILVKYSQADVNKQKF